MVVLRSHAPAGYVCPFCALVRGDTTGAPVPSDVVAETSDALVAVSPRWWPRNAGHVLVFPRRHYEDLYSAPARELHAVVELAQRAAVVLREIDGCDGTSLRQHNEPAGGQDVWHFHLHVFPRWNGDELYRSDPEPTFAPEGRRADRAVHLRTHVGWRTSAV